MPRKSPLFWPLLAVASTAVPRSQESRPLSKRVATQRLALGHRGGPECGHAYGSLMGLSWVSDQGSVKDMAIL